MVANIQTSDYHTAGEPFRIVTDGVDTPLGDTVLDRRSWAQENLDEVRAFLINEPRGHADMYGCFVTPPNDSDGDLGVVFFHKDGFSTACGHGTIALTTWALDTGVVVPDLGRPTHADGSVVVFVDAPSGRLRTEATLDLDGRVSSVRFWNVPSFVSASDIAVETSYGTLKVDVAFGGAFYGSVDLRQTDLAVESGDLIELIDLGRQIKAQFVGHAAVRSPEDARLSGMYGVIFHQEIKTESEDYNGDAVVQQRNVTVFADGEVDRSPCGSGTSARLALLHHHGRLSQGERFLNHGIAGGVFDGRIEHLEGPHTHTSVSGSAYATGQSQFMVDPRDELGRGFQLR